MVNKRSPLSRNAFYVLSWTWGFLMSFIGLLVIGCTLAYGKIMKKSYKLEKHGYCYYLPIGKSWGGVNFGVFFLTDNSENVSTKWHEHGHAIQNCFWGPLMLLVIAIPSVTRYWYREFRYSRKGLTPPTAYTAIWFEKDATLTGRKYKKYLIV